MFGLIFGLILAVAGVVSYLVFNKKKEESRYGGEVSYPLRKYKWIPAGICLFLAVLFIVLSCFTSVETGKTGVVTTFGKVEDYTLDAGIHFLAPWHSVTEMDNRVQKATVDMACFSSDIQEVSCKYTLNYQISRLNAQDIYRTVGKEYFDTVITPNVAEAVKTIMAHYTAENLIGNRDSLANEIEQLLAQSLEKYNIEVVSTAIEDMDFTDEFTNAVEAKQVAVQNKLKATTEQEQKTIEAQQAAERTKIEASAAAEVAKIQAQADLEVQKINADAAEYTGQKEAAKNKAINESLTGDLLEYYLIQQWNGVYPETYMGADNVSTIVDINKRGSESES